MKNNLSCEIIADLLPSYIDGLTSDVTNDAIREHLSHCEKCKSTLENMKEPYNEDRIISEKKEIDFLKKARKKSIKTIVFSLLSVLLIVATVCTTLPYAKSYTLKNTEVYCDLDTDTDNFIFTAAAKDSDFAVRDVEYKSENGVLKIDFISGKRLPLNKEKFFKWEYPVSDINEVVIAGETVWANGKEISLITSRVYELKTPYIGDMSHNRMIASALNMSEHLGTFTNALTTSKEPYKWEIILSDPLISGQNLKEKKELMNAYACTLLAVIGNLSEVIFTYDVIAEDGNSLELSQNITKELAYDIYGIDVKKCGESIDGFQQLMEKIGLADSPYKDEGNRNNWDAEIEETVVLDIFNASEQTIKNISVYCKELNRSVGYGLATDKFDLNIFGTGTVYSARNLHFELDNLGKNLYSEERLGKLHLTVSICDDKDNVYVLEPEITVSASFGAVYSFVIEGNADDGFTLKQG